jgi:Immunity protein 61
MTSLYEPSSELVDWAARAGYALTLSQASNAAVFWSDPGGEIRYYCRLQDHQKECLTRSDRDGPEKFVLLAAAGGVLERFLIARFGNVIRDLLGLDVLRAPWSANQVADGCVLTDLDDDGYRSLIADGSKVATAREGTLSLLALVPLSHYMRMSTADLIASFLDAKGAPLLVNGAYS